MHFFITILGISGNVTIKDGDRVADYALLDQVDPDNGTFEVNRIKILIYFAIFLYGAQPFYEFKADSDQRSKKKGKT